MAAFFGCVRAYDAAGGDAGNAGLDVWHARTSRGHHTLAPVSQSPQEHLIPLSIRRFYAPK